ncbi:MAG: SDR family oxidoreductase [Caldilineales bacterium]|nr:SDR family oxidoreductase [Caldilineales bacterium]
MHPTYDFRERVVCVTGAGRGIGLAMTAAFSAAGAAVCVNDIDADSADQVAAELRRGGHDALAFVADVADPAGVGELFAAIDARWGRIDVLINNAGIEPVHSLFDHPLADWQRTLDVNLTAAFLCTQQAARRMRDQGGGVILNIASIAGKSQPLYLRAAYAASKAGLVGFSKEAAREFAAHQIRVNAICPGVIITPMTEHLRHDEAQMARWRGEIPLARLGEAEEVANLALWLASDAASYITGAAWHVDGGKNMA